MLGSFFGSFRAGRATTLLPRAVLVLRLGAGVQLGIPLGAGAVHVRLDVHSVLTVVFDRLDDLDRGRLLGRLFGVNHQVLAAILLSHMGRGAGVMCSQASRSLIGLGAGSSVQLIRAAVMLRGLSREVGVCLAQ